MSIYCDAIRDLRDKIRMDEECLAAFPLGPIQKSRLRKRIAEDRERLKRLNKEKRDRKRKVKP